MLRKEKVKAHGGKRDHVPAVWGGVVAMQPANSELMIPLIAFNMSSLVFASNEIVDFCLDFCQ